MKLNPNQNSTHRPTSDDLLKQFESQTGDWTEAQQLLDDHWMAEYSEELATGLKRPNPPTTQAIERAQFKDKTFRWNGKWV